MYQLESTNVSIVSVSRRAGPPHFGQVVFTNSATRPSGDPCVCVISICSGNRIGNSLSATGIGSSGEHLSQYTIGIGVPQYLWRLTPQSFKRYVTVEVPNPFALANSAIFSCACTHPNPLHTPESITTASSSAVYGNPGSSAPAAAGAITRRTGNPYFCAN